MASDVIIDVIIPTKDRPAQLTATLSALARQDSPEFGVIVVDDGGTVDAQQAVPPQLRDSLRIRFLRNAVSTGPGPARNRGVAESGARCVILLDDDCLAAPGLVGRHRATLSGSTGPVVSLGAIMPPPRQRLSVWNHWDADRLAREYARLRDGHAAPGWRQLYTGNVGLRRVDFLAAGGFDPRFRRQEDVELGYRLGRLGCRFEFDSAAVVFHDSDRTLASWLRIPAASARFDVLMDRLDPETGRLSSVLADLDDRHWALRLARRVVHTPAGRRRAARAAAWSGRILHAARVDRVGLAAMSVAWDLTYCAALRDALAEPEPERSRL